MHTNTAMIILVAAGVLLSLHGISALSQQSIHFKSHSIFAEPIGLGVINLTHVLTKVAIKIDVERVKQTVTNCTEVAAKDFLLSLNGLIAKEENLIWCMIPTNKNTLGVTDICDVSEKSCGRNKRFLVPLLVTVSGVEIASVFFYTMWVGVTAQKAIEDLQSQHNEVIRVLESSHDNFTNVQKMEQETMVKIEALTY